MNIRLTKEQQKIIDTDLEPGEILKIIAFAGTGKTSTLVAYAGARPRMRFLYLAFNKSVQVEASKKFPDNVTCKTSHALAFQSLGHRYQDRIVPRFRANEVLASLQLRQFEDAQFTIDTLTSYLISPDPKVSKRHIPFQAAAFYKLRKEKMPDFIELANQLGRLMCHGTDERIGMLHDGYLKLYQLSKPGLNYDCILLDEAQDINPVTSAFVMDQARPGPGRKTVSIILVGDSHQQIYSFRGAKDTLHRTKASKIMYLTNSFRFDNNIARTANMVLRIFKGEKRAIKGTPLDRESKPPWDTRNYTVIARTNAAVFDKAAKLSSTRKIGFVGGIQGYRLNLINDLYLLFSKNKNQIMDRFISSFREYEALKIYADSVEDYELLSICKVVENYKMKIPALLKMVREKAVDADAAEVKLTTVHKAKGLEWDNVLLAGDFPKLVGEEKLIDPLDLDPDEFNLIYVAITRTKNRLRFDKGNTIPEFIKLVQRPAV